MFHFFKRKKIVLDAFTSYSSAYKNSPLTDIKRSMPEEFKKLPATYDAVLGENLTTKFSTLKGCIGATNLFTTGFQLPLWCDVEYCVNEDGSYTWSSAGEFNSNEHDMKQVWDTFYPEHVHIKMISPWRLRETTGVKFAWFGADWHDTENRGDIKILPAILDYKYQSGTHINMMVKRGCKWSGHASMPMVHIVPLTEKEVVLKTHLVDQSELNKMFPKTNRFRKSYIHNKRMMTENERKCPFSGLFK
jgi:hypothetical protein